MKIALIALFIIGFLLGYIIGGQTVRYQELNWCVDTGLKVMDLKGIEIDINKKLITVAVMMYKNRIGELTNAFVYNNTGN